MNPSASSEKWSACFGSDVKTGTDLLRLQEERARKPRLATHIAPFDHLVHGGLARGASIELAPPNGDHGFSPSTGRFSVEMAALAAAIQAGEAAAFVDLGDHLDPQAAAEAGVDLSRLLWIRPAHLNQAVMSAEMVLNAGFGLVVLDLGVVPFPSSSLPESTWVRLSRAARDHAGILLLVSPTRLPAGAAEIVIQAGAGRALWLQEGASSPLLTGLSSRFGVKSRHATFTDPIRIDFTDHPPMSHVAT